MAYGRGREGVEMILATGGVMEKIGIFVLGYCIGAIVAIIVFYPYLK